MPVRSRERRAVKGPAAGIRCRLESGRALRDLRTQDDRPRTASPRRGRGQADQSRAAAVGAAEEATQRRARRAAHETSCHAAISSRAGANSDAGTLSRSEMVGSAASRDGNDWSSDRCHRAFRRAPKPAAALEHGIGRSRGDDRLGNGLFRVVVAESTRAQQESFRRILDSGAESGRSAMVRLRRRPDRTSPAQEVRRRFMSAPEERDTRPSPPLWGDPRVPRAARDGRRGSSSVLVSTIRCAREHGAPTAPRSTPRRTSPR